ncbi:hypothetical protein KAR91_80880 [Candidatus Pacearchaeota archaeon]|nr:hypothetical protein [Candidatus Pacearchaeota archaeon]
MTTQELIKNGFIEFESERDIMTVHHIENTQGWAKPFVIMLNCKCIADFKTFKRLKNKVDKLCSERGLIQL